MSINWRRTTWFREVFGEMHEYRPTTDWRKLTFVVRTERPEARS